VPERPNERLARHVVSTVLGVPVTRFEDGNAPAQVDALIHEADGCAALEIVADHEDAFNAQWDALEKTNHRVDVRGLRAVWSAQLARGASVKRVLQELPALMIQWQDNTSPRSRRMDLPDDFTRLGIRMLYQSERDGQPGYVRLHAEPWGGFASSEGMEAYVARILEEQPDVPAKLAAHPSDRKHAFIWTTTGTEYGIQSQLERRDQPLPQEPAQLPDGVTHVWIAGSFTTQGALAWFPDRGWWRTPWEWPANRALILHD
jgi:hypothetical protein